MNNKTLSEDNINIFSSLQSTVSVYPIDLNSFEELILSIKQEVEIDQSVITSKIDNIFKTLLMTLLNFQVDTEIRGWQKLCGVPEDRLVALKKVLQAVCGGRISQKIKRSVVISFIENVLECLGVNDLTEVLDVISSQIPRFASQLQEADQVKLLRVINVLLKTVSKTQDYHLRGQLHLTLTRFLPLCHDSGFHFRGQTAKASDWEKLEANEESRQTLEPGLTYEFYQQFWELQKWLVEPHQMAGDMLNRLKKIQQVLKQVQKYFQIHKAKENSDYYTQPIKYLKNYNLLALQLGDLTFRKTIMLQVLLFGHALTHPMNKNPIHLSETDKKIMIEIQNIAKKFLTNCGQEGKLLLLELPNFLSAQIQWTELKQLWKDKKKTFLKKAEEYAEEETKSKEQNRKIQKQLQKRKVQVRKIINQKMKIDGSKIQKYLQNQEPLSLDTSPVYTSFSYFFPQAQSCLQSFDKDNGKQTQFQTRAEYNMFEWKAMRSLYRENIKDIWSNNDKAAPKMKQYRLISLMSRKQDDFTDPEPSKKVKLE